MTTEEPTTPFPIAIMVLTFVSGVLIGVLIRNMMVGVRDPNVKEKTNMGEEENV